jgi:hypothetical protein
MKAVLPDADVRGYQALVPGLTLPDPDDRHVLAAAITGGASLIVTWNIKDFPEANLKPHGIACISPDAFLVELHGLLPEALLDSVVRARENLRRSLPSADDFIDALAHQGLADFVAILRQKMRSSESLRHLSQKLG